MLSFICIKIYELNTMKTWLEMWNIIEEKKEKKKYPQLCICSQMLIWIFLK